MAEKLFIGSEETRQKVLAFIAALSLEKTPWTVTVAPYRRNRSLEQNALYWKWLGIVATETGHTADEIHEFCKAKFLPPVFVDIGGEVQEIRRTTTKLKVDDMSVYMNQVEAWAGGELGIALPHPEDMHVREG